MLLRMFRPGLFSALLALLATPAAAVDYVVGGAMLSLKDVAYPGRGPVVLSLEDASIPVPLPGSADDPSLSVMRVTLFGRGSGESSARDTIPSSGLWVVRATPSAIAYGYRNPTAGRSFGTDVVTAQLRSGGTLRVRLDDSPLTHAQPEGAIAVRVEWGSVRVCTIFDGAAVRRNEQRLFVARNADVPAIADCDDASLAGL